MNRHIIPFFSAALLLVVGACAAPNSQMDRSPMEKQVEPLDEAVNGYGDPTADPAEPATDAENTQGEVAGEAQTDGKKNDSDKKDGKKDGKKREKKKKLGNDRKLNIEAGGDEDKGEALMEPTISR